MLKMLLFAIFAVVCITIQTWVIGGRALYLATRDPEWEQGTFVVKHAVNDKNSYERDYIIVTDHGTFYVDFAHRPVSDSILAHISDSLRLQTTGHYFVVAIQTNKQKTP